MQVRKQQLELDMEQQTGSKGGRQTPVVVDLLLDLRHGCLLSLTDLTPHSTSQPCPEGVAMPPDQLH